MSPRPAFSFAVLAAALLLAAALACGGGDGSGGDACDAWSDPGCIDADRILADVVTLAGPAMTGRRAGTPGNDAAVDLVARRFESLGLAPVPGASSLRHPFPLTVWTAARPPSLRLGEASYTVGEGEGLDVVEFSATGTVTGAPVVFAGHGIVIPPYDAAEWPSCPADPATGYDDFSGVDVEGKVLVILRGYPGDDLRWRDDCPVLPSNTGRVLNAQTRGAAAVVFGPRFGEDWTGATADHFRIPSTRIAIPVVQITRDVLVAAVPDAAARQATIDGTRTPASAEIAGLTADVDVAGTIEQRFPANVLGVVEGTDPALRQEVVVIGAHLDHMGEVPFRNRYYPGADDNASGTAVLLELARASARSPVKPKRTLLFAAWNAEELGLVGSSRYVDDPAYPLDDTVVAFSVDMVGDGRPGLLVFGGTEFPEIPATMQAGAEALALPDAWPIVPIDQSYGSDHAPFAEMGVPAVLLLTPAFDDHHAYHTPGDTAAVVTRDTLDAAAKLVWAAVREYAFGTERRGAAAALRVGAAPACFGPWPALAADEPDVRR